MITKNIILHSFLTLLTINMSGQILNDTCLVKQEYLKELAPLTKVYKNGDSGSEVLKIKEWLMLWQLNENYVDLIIELDTTFNDETEKLVKEIQKFLNIEPTGVVNQTTWQAIVNPLNSAFNLNSYNNLSIREKMKYFATKHLQFRSSELDEDNIGPWIRSYMNGYDGDWAYWCQAFACTILDQTFSSIGKHFDLYYSNTWSCETMREHARDRGLLITLDDIKSKRYTPEVGDIVLYLEGSSRIAHHTEIIYEILDEENGLMLTIGGNTNFAGSRNGVGTFLVNRNFLKDDVEIVKMIDLETIHKMDKYPENVKDLLRSYPDQIIRYSDNHLFFKDGSKLLFDDFKKKNTAQLLFEPSIKDQFYYPYEKGVMKTNPKAYDDPGRITNEAFFKTMYGSTKAEVEQKLVEITWCPKLSGEKVKVTTVNGVDKKLKAVSAELDKHPELKPFISNICGTYNWRKVKGTNRLSLHSYGIAIDINVKKSNYWQWDCKCTNEKTELNYTNHIPQLIVDIFEKNGFIWGGKWYHYDTMHFEYRPELLMK